MQIDIRQQRRNRAALRGAGHLASHHTVLHHSRAQHRAQKFEHRLITNAFLDCLHQLLVRNRRKAVRDIDVPLGRSSLVAPLDVEPKEIQPVAHVQDPGLGLRKPQPQWGQHTGDLFAQGFDIGLVSVDEHDEIAAIPFHIDR